MIASFAAYQLLISMLMGCAALAAEPLLIRWRRPSRFLWAAALCASLIFPLAMSLAHAPEADTTLVIAPQGPAAPGLSSSREHRELGPTSLAPALSRATAHSIASSTPARFRMSVESIVRFAWPASSVALWLFYLMGLCRLLLVLRASPAVRVMGTDVLLTENFGPAVFGVWRPVILWPQWLQMAVPSTRRAALAHELEHLRSRDPLLLAVAMLLVSLAPWNPLLWWQLRRLRFAVEADCDARVIDHGASAGGYADILWHIGRRRSDLNAALAILMSTPTWLERRIRRLLQPSSRGGWLAKATAPVGVLLLIGAAWVHAPSLAASQLRKLPPQDTSPAAGWAIAAARAQFPDLFQRTFEGTAVVAAVFDRDGHLKLAAQHRFAPGTPPADFDMSLENRRLDIDPNEDVLISGDDGFHIGSTIGPWLSSHNPGRLFIVYEVLKWQPDPTRRGARVLAALKAYAPALLVKTVPITVVSVVMNNDGTVNRLQKKMGTSFDGDLVSMFEAMGVAKNQLGRTGTTVEQPSGAFISYAWPRRADDAPDVADLDKLRQRMGSHPPHEDDADDVAIAQRYFPDIVRKGRAAVTYRIDGKEARVTPWILFGRDGRVWGTGLWHNDSLRTTGPRSSAIEPRYPGTLVASDVGSTLHGVPISTLWIAPDSSVQSKDQLRWSQQQLLASGNIFLRVLDRPPGATGPAEVPLGFAAAMNFGATAYTGGFPQHPLMMMQASPVGPDEVLLSVRFSVCGIGKGVYRATESCLRSAQVRARYDTPIDIPLSQDPEAQAMYTRIVVRIQRLRT